MQRRIIKKSSMAVFFFIVFVSLAIPSVLAAAATNTAVIRNIMAYCTVTESGERLEMIQVTVNDPKVLEYVMPTEFLVFGKAYGKGENQRNGFLSEKTHDFTAAVERIEKDGNFLKLYFTGLEDNFYYIDSFLVASRRDANLNFSLEDINWVEVETADAFQTKAIENDSGLLEITYRIFEPKGKGAASPKPLLLALHDTGDQQNLLANRVAVAWAEEESQEQNPCYVFAPVFDNQEEMAMGQTLDRAVREIQSMVSAGKVDPTRIYVVGKGMGGGNAIKAAAAYPELFAGVLAFCPDLKGVQAESYAALEGMPIYLVQAAEDPECPIGGTRNFYSGIKAAGNQSIKIAEYTPEKMLAGGVTAADSHHIDRIALKDWRYSHWLFQQRKNGEDGLIQYIRAFTAVEAEGQRLTRLDITVGEETALAGITAADFTIQATDGSTGAAVQGTVQKIAVNGTTLQVELANLPVAYHKVSALQVVCNKNAALSFSKEEIRDTVTEIADNFGQYRKANGAASSYNVFGPNQIKKAIPLIVIFQADGVNPLLESDAVTKWADTRQQAAYPAFVLAPMYQGNDPSGREQAEEQMAEMIRQWIQDGLVQEGCIYAIGVGGGKEKAAHMAKTYPELFSEGPWK